MSWYMWLYLLLFYVLILVFLVILPASLGVSLGLRQIYVELLLKVFEFGKKRIEARQATNVASDSIIVKTSLSPKTYLPRNKSFGTFTREFRMEDIGDFIKTGMEVIIEDEVTSRFDAEELPSWNLLTRTNLNYQFISWRLTLVWIVGFLVRYCILLPARASLAALAMCIVLSSMAIVPFLPSDRMKKWLASWATLIGFRIAARGLAAIITFHNPENRAKGGGICVANHTSPIDAIFLACDRNYALIGQMQGGIMGTVQKALLKAQDHIFFERGEMKDRQLVVRRMREHIEDPSNNPILIFPEGTCINNTSVMMFKKGSFEVGGTIYPVAIKYDPIFGNPFWNSMKEPMLTYLINICTSWAIVGDVWYLPPTKMQEGENAIDFANRVKRDIARQGGLVDLVWDGALKRAEVSPELKVMQQEKYADLLKLD